MNTFDFHGQTDYFDLDHKYINESNVQHNEVKKKQSITIIYNFKLSFQVL